MKKKITFHPELTLELNLSANAKSSSIKIKTAKDVVTILEGIKKTIKNHIILIYLDENDVVVEIDTFLMDLSALFKPPHPQQILAKTGYLNNTGRADKVIVAQNCNDCKNPNKDSIKIKKLLKLALQIWIMEIDIFDLILIGEEDYFSFKEQKRDWHEFQKKLSVGKKLTE